MGGFHRQVKPLGSADRTIPLIAPLAHDGVASLCVEFYAARAGNITPIDSCGNAVSLCRAFEGMTLLMTVDS